ncbi:MAG: CCA tRNA nucleotidyltransferase [Clostridia bacterium]|nr:CCA tRNA nucleotidyltransferase [Clostridia bacterium]
MLISENATYAISLLNKAGYEAYLVGGCVRDMLMNIPPHDYDITTSALPSEMKEVFKDFRTIETGLKHGTLTVIINNESLEITTYRIDGEYKDNRHPESVTFSRSLKDDLLRRDFTINAIAYNEKIGTIDLFDGENDIKNKIIRAVGNPEKRFNEDALRILRAIRFSSTLGFEIENETKKAMIKCAPLLHNIAKERISVEIEKFLLGKNVKNALLENYEVLSELICELKKMYKFDQKNKWHIYDILEHTAVAIESAPKIPHLRLAMLLHDTGKVHTFSIDENGVGHFYGHGEKSAEIAREYLNRYKYDNFTKDEVYNLVKLHDLYTEEDRVLVKKRLNRIGKERFLDLLKIQRADNMAQNPALVNLSHIDELERLSLEISNEQCFSLSSLKINGTDLIFVGFRGREIGNTLNILLNEVIEEKLQNDKQALIKRAIEIKNDCN